MATETLRQSTWTNSGGSQTGSFSSPPPGGSFESTSNTAAYRQGTGASKSHTWSSFVVSVDISDGTVQAGEDAEGGVFTTSTLTVRFSVDGGSTWTNLVSESDEGLAPVYLSGTYSASVSANPSGAILFEFVGARGNKIGLDGIVGVSYCAITDFKIVGTYPDHAVVLSHAAPGTGAGKTVYASNMWNESTGVYSAPGTSTPATFLLDGSNGCWFLESYS